MTPSRHIIRRMDLTCHSVSCCFIPGCGPVLGLFNRLVHGGWGWSHVSEWGSYSLGEYGRAIGRGAATGGSYTSGRFFGRARPPLTTYPHPNSRPYLNAYDHPRNPPPRTTCFLALRCTW
ncbi:MAG: hypothetical protein IPL78_25970 [Chloroflexi bacterium]|nr:hypothetical protein [Chloroflexota bacterium]